MLKQKDILETVIAMLKEKYPKPETGYYTDEVVKGFKQPCFFVKLVKQRNTETKNTNSNNVSIVLTYFANPAKNKQLAFLDCKDNIDYVFGNGFQVADRYLHVKSITSEQIGEERDILQLNIGIDYLDSTGYDRNYDYKKKQLYDPMQDARVDFKNIYS